MQNKTLHNYIPRWMLNILEKKTCPSCKKKSKRQNITGFGIKQLSQYNFCWCIDHKCNECDKKLIINFSSNKIITPIDLCYDILEQNQKQKKMRASKMYTETYRGDASLISDGEIEEMKKFLSSSESHDDFMNYIGCKKIQKVDRKEKDQNESQ